MHNLEIADIELKMSVQDFETALQHCIDNYSEHMNYALKPMRTKRGKSMYKLSIDNGDNDTIDIIGEQDDVSGDIHFHPLKLQNMNESFYSTHYCDYDTVGQPEDPAMFVCYALSELCDNHKGSFAYIDPNGDKVVIKDGTRKRSLSVALVDGDGNVYSCAGAKNIKGASEESEFTVKKPIGEWLNENPDVQRAIAKLPLSDKMNYIGQYLIKAKLTEEIDSDEFMDIFCQAGIFGFSDKSVLNIYKLLM